MTILHKRDIQQLLLAVFLQAGSIHKSLLTLSCVIRGLADNQVRAQVLIWLLSHTKTLWLMLCSTCKV